MKAVEFPYAVVDAAADDECHYCGELGGLTRMDMDVCFSQFKIMCSSFCFGDLHFILRWLRVTTKDKGETYERHINRPVVTVFARTEAAAKVVTDRFGLTGRSPPAAASPAPASPANAVPGYSWSTATSGRGKPVKAPVVDKDYNLVPIRLWVKEVYLGKDMDSLLFLKVSEFFERFCGVIIGPIALAAHYEAVLLALQNNHEIYLGLDPTTVFLCAGNGMAVLAGACMMQA